jgi:hypothetical protein
MLGNRGLFCALLVGLGVSLAGVSSRRSTAALTLAAMGRSTAASITTVAATTGPTLTQALQQAPTAAAPTMAATSGAKPRERGTRMAKFEKMAPLLAPLARRQRCHEHRMDRPRLSQLQDGDL